MTKKIDHVRNLIDMLRRPPTVEGLEMLRDSFKHIGTVPQNCVELYRTYTRTVFVNTIREIDVVYLENLREMFIAVDTARYVVKHENKRRRTLGIAPIVFSTLTAVHHEQLNAEYTAEKELELLENIKSRKQGATKINYTEPTQYEIDFGIARQLKQKAASAKGSANICSTRIKELRKEVERLDNISKRANSNNDSERVERIENEIRMIESELDGLRTMLESAREQVKQFTKEADRLNAQSMEGFIHGNV